MPSRTNTYSLAMSAGGDAGNIPNKDDFKSVDPAAYIEKGGLEKNLSLVKNQGKLQEMYKQGLGDEAAKKFLVDVSVDTTADNSIKVEDPKPTPYAWFVLFLVFWIRAIH